MREAGRWVDELRGVKPDIPLEAESSLSYNPTSCTPGFTPRSCRVSLLLQGPLGAVDFDLACMSTLFKVLMVAACLLFDAASVSAADCPCDRLSAEGCQEGQPLAPEPAGPPQWCERMDDPRCMPASPHGTSFQTFVPLASGWAQSIHWKAPPRAGVLMDVRADGEERSEHARRVERPPR